MYAIRSYYGLGPGLGARAEQGNALPALGRVHGDGGGAGKQCDVTEVAHRRMICVAGDDDGTGIAGVV